ncbi:EF-hand calcium-binding domain-containing protein 10 [Allomyces javanicus]|nr:EF-hand calcium-binding domain-containing protein 10 [Allomyces javanicus]
MNGHPAAPGAGAGLPASIAEQVHAAQGYLEAHQIAPVMHRLMALLVYHRPDDPRAFMAQRLRELHALRVGNTGKAESTHLFTRTDLERVYQLHDPAGHGTMTREQFVQAMASLGLAPDTYRVPQHDGMTMAQFVDEGMRAAGAVLLPASGAAAGTRPAAPPGAPPKVSTPVRRAGVPGTPSGRMTSPAAGL